jgi:hypothetical protein
MEWQLAWSAYHDPITMVGATKACLAPTVKSQGEEIQYKAVYTFEATVIWYVAFIYYLPNMKRGFLVNFGITITFCSLDNSEHMRNGDYMPTRIEAQQDVANLICGIFIVCLVIVL